MKAIQLKTAAEIKAAVAMGKTVYAGSEMKDQPSAYIVKEDVPENFIIKCTLNDHIIGLHGVDETKLNYSFFWHLVDTININPTWKEILPVLLAAAEGGDAEGRKEARKNLERMAEICDEAARMTENHAQLICGTKNGVDHYEVVSADDYDQANFLYERLLHEGADQAIICRIVRSTEPHHTDGGL